MTDPIGFRQGQRVTSLASSLNGEAFEGIVEMVVAPEKGPRYAIISDAGGICHHRWFHEIEPISRWEPISPMHQGSGTGLTIGFGQSGIVSEV